MKQGINKDWTDAVREKALSDGTTPSTVSWEMVGRRVRRSAAIRRAALAAAAAIPVLALLLWAPWKTPSLPSSPVAQVSSPATPPVILSDSEGSPSPDVIPDPFPVVIPDLIGNLPPVTPAAPPVIPDPSPVIPDTPLVIADTPVILSESEGSPSSVIPDLIGNPPPSRQKPRLALGLRAGAGTIRRAADIALESAPYIAALTYLNATDAASLPKVKSNTSNTLPYSVTANDLYPDAGMHYSHDLPLTLGLSVRLDLSPRFGVESGLEYTYLHSVGESVSGRLDQRLHFIGIPLRADTRLWTGKGFDLYMGAGVKMEKCVSAVLGRIACEEPRLQWSAEAFGGIQYRLGDRTHLYFQPALSYYFTKTDLPTCRTEHPLSVSLHAGLRFDL